MELKSIFPYRSGIHQQRRELAQDKIQHQNSLRKRVTPHDDSLFMKYRSGTPFTKEFKQNVINLYQGLLDEGKTIAFAITKTSKLLGVSRKSVEKFIKEKLGTGKLRDNVIKRNR